MSIFLIKPCQKGGAGQPGTAAGEAGNAGGLRSPLLPLLPSPRAVSVPRWGCGSPWSSCSQSSAARLGPSLEMRAQVAQALRWRGMLPWDITAVLHPLPWTSTQLHLLMLLPASWHHRCGRLFPRGCRGAAVPAASLPPSMPARSPHARSPCPIPLGHTCWDHLDVYLRPRWPPTPLQHSLPTTPSCAVPP